MARLLTGNKDISVASKQAPGFFQVNFHLRPMKSSFPTSSSWLCWIVKAKCTTDCKVMPSNYKVHFPPCAVSGMFITLLSAATFWSQYKQHLRKVKTLTKSQMFGKYDQESGSHFIISKSTVRLARMIPKLFSSGVKLKTLDTPLLCVSLQVPRELTLMASNFKILSA